MLYPRLGPYSLVSRRNQTPSSCCILPLNIYLIAIFINERQQLWDERRDIARRILYLNMDEALMVDDLVKAGNSYLQGTCRERLVLEFTIANLLSLSLERQHDQWYEQDHQWTVRVPHSRLIGWL